MLYGTRYISYNICKNMASNLLEIPILIRSPKSCSLEPHQYLKCSRHSDTGLYIYIYSPPNHECIRNKKVPVCIKQFVFLSTNLSNL